MTQFFLNALLFMLKWSAIGCLVIFAIGVVIAITGATGIIILQGYAELRHGPSAQWNVNPFGVSHVVTGLIAWLLLFTACARRTHQKSE